MIYTKDMHAKNLLEMLEKKDPCSWCPGGFLDASQLGPDWNRWMCPVCRSFVGMEGSWGCPCHILGPHYAIKRTWIALEEGGYI